MTEVPRPEADPSSIRDVVAIDGPSGAGKSTVARALAARLAFAYLDTGAMYRAVTWSLLEQQVADVRDEAAVAAALDRLRLRIDPAGRVSVAGRDVTSHLRSHEVETLVSAVSALPAVRRRMRRLQREVAAAGPTVAEGRDMGSVVFPAARWKFFLDADAGERARRRHLDFVRSGRDVSPAVVREEIEVRDRLDSTRRDAPLRRPADATYVDTTGRSVEQVVDLIAERVRRAGGGEG